MPADDEFRKVAEDIGALARALGRDFRDAVDQARQGGHSPGGAVKAGLRGLGADARRTFYQHGAAGPWGPCAGRGRRGYWSPGRTEGLTGPPQAGRTAGPPPWIPGRPWVPRPGYAGGPPWAGPSWHRSRPPRPSMPPIRRRWDATTLVGTLAVVFGLAWLVSAVGAVHLSVEGVVAAGLMLLGAALVVTARTDWSLSRRSWPVWLGAAMIVVLVATSTTFGIGSTLNSVSFGNTSRTAPAGGGTVHGGFGNLTVKVPAQEAGVVKVVSVAGETNIDTPANVPFLLNARVVGGQICVNGVDEANGVAAEYHEVIGATPTTPAAAYTLNVHQMFGLIQVGSPGCHAGQPKVGP